MNIFFIGTVEFSRKMLIKLIALNAQICGVATMKTSHYNSDFTDLTDICQQNKIPYKYILDINDSEVIEWIGYLEADIIFCFGWSRLLKKQLLNCVTMGVLGCHPAFLPLNRGRHPLIWALALGLEQTASTFFFMDEGADSGEILSQHIVTINYDDNASLLYKKIVSTSEKQIEEFLPLLSNNNYKTVKQDEKLSNKWRKRSKIDGEIDWRMTSRAIYNLVRSLSSPYPGAHLIYKGEEYKVWDVKEHNEILPNIEPGKVIEVCENKFKVKVYGGVIEVIKHELSIIPKIDEYL